MKYHVRTLTGTSIPTEGEFITGDIILNISETGVPGWICVEEGEPGKWEPITRDGNRVVVSKKTSNGITVELLENQRDGMYTIKASIELCNKIFTNEIRKFYTLNENDAISRLIDVIVEFEKEGN